MRCGCVFVNGEFLGVPLKSSKSLDHFSTETHGFGYPMVSPIVWNPHVLSFLVICFTRPRDHEEPPKFGQLIWPKVPKVWGFGPGTLKEAPESKLEMLRLLVNPWLLGGFTHFFCFHLFPHIIIYIYKTILLYYIILYCIVLYCIIFYYIVYYMISYFIVLYHSIIMLYYIIILLYYIILYCIVLYYIILYYIILYHYIVLYYIIFYCILYDIVFYCIILYYYYILLYYIIIFFTI